MKDTDGTMQKLVDGEWTDLGALSSATVTDAEDDTGVVGRPATPVSVAGVTRRAVRRNTLLLLQQDGNMNNEDGDVPCDCSEDETGRIGRPLTPVSVAGSARRVGRRTARRNSFLLLQDDGVVTADVSDSGGTCTCGADGADATSGVAFCGIDDNEDKTGVVGRPLTPISAAGVARRHGLLLMELNNDGRISHVTAVSKSTHFGLPAHGKIQLLADNGPVTHSTASSTSTVFIAGVAMMLVGVVALVAAVFTNKQPTPPQSEASMSSMPTVVAL